jgi:excisionase family DNA binding protein
MPEQPSLLLTVSEAADLLGIGRNLAYELVRTGRIPSIRLGRVIRIPRFGLEQWVAQEAGLPHAPQSVVTSASQRH